MYDYNKLLSLGNSLFNPQCERLFMQIPKNIANSYYIATGLNIDKFKGYKVILSNLELQMGSNENDFNSINLWVIKGDVIGNNIIYDGSRIAFLCFVPEDIAEDEFDQDQRILILYNIYKSILLNTKPKISNLSILGAALEYIPEYLTITTFKTWYTGFEYDIFKSAVNSQITKEVFDAFKELEFKKIDYSSIFAIVNQDTV